MPDKREKLIELIQDAVDGCAAYWAGLIADHLIANGVTVQEWIPVSEPPKDSEPVLVCTKHRRPFKARYLSDRGRWDVSHSVIITHWMPLPEPPKGD